MTATLLENDETKDELWSIILSLDEAELDTSEELPTLLVERT